MPVTQEDVHKHVCKDSQLKRLTESKSHILNFMDKMGQLKFQLGWQRLKFDGETKLSVAVKQLAELTDAKLSALDFFDTNGMNVSLFKL